MKTNSILIFAFTCLALIRTATAQGSAVAGAAPVLVSSVKDHKGVVMSVAFSPDGRLLASGSWDKTVKLWAVTPALQPVASLDTTFKAGVSTLAFAPDGKTLAAAAWKEPFVLRWDMSGRTALPSWLLGSGSFGINQIAFSRDGRFLAAACSDLLARLVEVASPTTITPLSGHTHFVLSVAFSPDGRQVAAGGFTGETIRRWETASHQPLAAWKGDGSPVNALAYSPDGSLLAIGTEDGRVDCYDTKTGTVVVGWKEWTHVAAIAFAPTGRRLAIAGESKTSPIIIFDLDTQTGRGLTNPTSTSPVTALAFSPDGRLLASGSSRPDMEVCLWELASGNALKQPNASPIMPPPKSAAVPTPSIAETKWSGTPGLSIEFGAGGKYHEFWQGKDYPGVWKAVSDKEVSVSRKDGWDYVYKSMSDGRLKRVWVPKRGQPVQPDIIFTLISPPPESGASTAPTSPATTPAAALAILRDAQRPPAERIRTLELIIQQGVFAVPPLAEILISDVDLARQSRDQVHASGRGWGFSDDKTWELRRDMASGLNRAAGSDEKAIALAACVLAWTDWRDPSPGGVRAGQWRTKGDLQRLVPAIKPLFSHPSSAVRAGAMRLFIRQPQLAPVVVQEVWDCFAKAPPVEKIAAAYVLLEADRHVAEVLNELLPLMQNKDASLAEEAARALPVQGKPGETSARFLRDALKLPALRPLALKTLCNVWTKDQTIKQELFRAALVEPLEAGVALSFAFNRASKDGVQPLVEALTRDNVNTRRRAAAIVENGYLMPHMLFESWMTMKSRLPELTPTFLPALQHALGDSDAEVRCRAVNTLALIGTDAAASAPALARLLSDPERAVRWAAAWAMEKCSPGTASAECAKAVADRPMATGPAGDKLALIGYDPPILPLTLPAGTTFRVRVAYEMKSVQRCFVFGLPLLNGSPMPGGATNGSPTFSLSNGEARLEAYSPRNGGKMDQFGVYLKADTGSGKLVEIIFDTPTTWTALAGKQP